MELRPKPGIRGEKPATNRLGYGTDSTNCYCMRIVLGNVPIFKSTPLPVVGPSTVTAWNWNVAIYTPLN
jgi:hypothetical protein